MSIAVLIRALAGTAGLAALAAAVVVTLPWWTEGPLGPLPGGRLAGPEARCPDDFGFARDVRQVALEVDPEAPRSVTTWAVVHGGALIVPADFLTPWKRWPQRVEADPRVRVRVEGRVFRCRAERVRDAATIEALRRATARKYDVAPDGWAAGSEIWWYRLVPRAEAATGARAGPLRRWRGARVS